MNGHTKGNYSAQWSLYANPELLRVAAQRTEDKGWVTVTLETKPELATEVAVADEIQPTDASPERDERKLYRLSLRLRLEEIPRLVAVLNEIYLSNHEEAVRTLEFARTEEWGERRVKAGRLSIAFPLGSRLEPESKREDWEDRIAALQAYRVIGETPQ